MKSKILFCELICILCVNLFGQTNIHYATFSNPTTTQDACVFSLYPNNTYPSEQELNMLAWTWQGRYGIVRSLLRFGELNNIPSNAIILSAYLQLNGVSSGSITPQGNSYYSGVSSAFPINECVIGTITQYWNENTVTWNNQPTFDTSNAIIIPASTQQWNEGFFVNSPLLVSMVQQMVSVNNYGFIIKLRTEGKYRSRIFASSDNPDEKLYPTLGISYIYCNADFDYCSSSTEYNTYSFHSTGIGNAEYTWTINGEEVSTEADFDYAFVDEDTNLVCLTVTDQNGLTCEKCVSIITIYQDYESYDDSQSAKIACQESSIPQVDIIEGTKMSVYPNPSDGVFDIEIQGENVLKCNYRLRVVDTVGNVLEERCIKTNKETVVLPKFSKGIHFVELLQGDEVLCSEKLLMID